MRIRDPPRDHENGYYTLEYDWHESGFLRAQMESD
jgi:hypothetical protein